MFYQTWYIKFLIQELLSDCPMVILNCTKFLQIIWEKNQGKSSESIRLVVHPDSSFYRLGWKPKVGGR